jgi:hypothetical protein
VYTCVDVRCEKSREKKRLPIGQSRDAGRDVTFAQQLAMTPWDNSI